MKIRSILLFTQLLVTTLYSSAQNEANHWMFGFGAGINFSSGVPVSEPGSTLETWEGSASVSDPITGNLLVYTDGSTVYTANHTVMPNGTGLNGHSSSTQSALIVPKPGSATQFYIFTSDEGYVSGGSLGYNYSVVDMTLNVGLGDVVPTQKNVLMFGSSSEQLSAVKHANCVDWWIMTKEHGGNTYRAYLLTSTGISEPVNSTIGVSLPVYSPGQAKFSPDGTKYAITTNGPLTQLFDFDNVTGLLSNSVTLMSDTTGFLSYGLSFSGDNSKLYIGHVGMPGNLYQYDLSSEVPATIIASRILIGELPNTGQFQLGKDFKIYIADNCFSSLSVINAPNALGTACGYSAGSVSITGSCRLGICNFPDSYFNQSSPCPITSVSIPEEAELIPYIPNVITPNGDGINDVFQIDNLPPASSLEILNRWGNPVFTTGNYDNNWIGSNADGTYFYMLKTPKGKTFSGFVQVVTGH